jgi:hypothetical protein
MTLAQQLKAKGLVPDALPDKQNTKKQETAFDENMLTLRHNSTVLRSWIAGLTPEFRARYHDVIRAHKLHVVAVTADVVRFAARPRRSYVGFCLAARRKYNKDAAKARRRGRK